MKSASVALSISLFSASFILAVPAWSIAPVVSSGESQSASPSPVAPASAEHIPTTSFNRETEDPDPGAENVEASIKNYLMKIDTLETEGNSYDIRLAETAYGLGSALQQAGEHQKAIAAFRRAMEIMRINNGIYSASQEPMLRSMIESQKAIHDDEAVASHYQDLIWIKSKSRVADDPGMILLLEEASQWHLNVYQRETDQDAEKHLLTSYKLRANAIDLMYSRYGPFHLPIIPQLRSLISACFHLARHQLLFVDRMGAEPTASSNFESPGFDAVQRPQNTLMLLSSYSSGRAAYERIIRILDSNLTASNREKAAAHAELGDWHLLFGHRSAAREAYLEANRIISEDSNQQQLAQELFGTPKMLPVNLIANEDQENNSRDILVEFDVLASGNVSNISVLDSGPETSASLQETARGILQDTKFRPAIIGGKLTEVRGMKLRVSVTES